MVLREDRGNFLSEANKLVGEVRRQMEKLCSRETWGQGRCFLEKMSQCFIDTPKEGKIMRCILAITAFLMVVCSANVMATGFVKIGEKSTWHPLGKIEAGMVYDPIQFKEPNGQTMQFQEDNENKAFTVWHDGEVIKQYSGLYVPVVKQIKDNDTGRTFYILYCTLTVSTKNHAHIIIGYDLAQKKCIEYVNTLDYFKPIQGYDEVKCYIGSPNRFILFAHRLYDGYIEGYQLTWDEKVNGFRKEPFEIDEHKTIDLNQI